MGLLKVDFVLGIMGFVLLSEYIGLLECLTRALQLRETPTYLLKWTRCFWLSSSLVDNLGHADLKTSSLSIDNVYVLAMPLTHLRISWVIRHIYREFNQTADALSDQAIDERDTNGPSQFW